MKAQLSPATVTEIDIEKMRAPAPGEILLSRDVANFRTLFGTHIGELILSATAPEARSSSGIWHADPLEIHAHHTLRGVCHASFSFARFENYTDSQAPLYGLSTKVADECEHNATVIELSFGDLILFNGQRTGYPILHRFVNATEDRLSFETEAFAS